MTNTDFPSKNEMLLNAMIFIASSMRDSEIELSQILDLDPDSILEFSELSMPDDYPYHFAFDETSYHAAAESMRNMIYPR